MLSEKEILQIAEKYVKQIEEESKLSLIIATEYTIKKKYGHIYFYTDKKYYETKDEKYNTLAGGGPFLVENETGKVIQFGSSQTEEYYIQEYEAGRYPYK